MATVKPIKTKVELKVEPDTEAKVVERKDGKIITYAATVSEKEIVNDGETEDSEFIESSELDDDTDETSFLSHAEQTAPTLRKTRLEIMFGHIREAIQTERLDDSFYAFVVRQPDAIESRYNYPCGRETELGVFQFTSRDMFAFPAEIHRRNNNSGGTFNITVYRSDTRQPLELRRRSFSNREYSIISVGLMGYTLSNPVKDDLNAPANNSSNGVENQIMALIEKQDERFQRFLEQQNAPKEKSLVEKAFEAKILKDIADPPQQQNGLEAMQTMMMQMFAAPVMIEGFSRKMFPEPPPPEQRDWFDRVSGALELPAVQGALGRIGEIAEAITISKLEPPTVRNPDDYEDEAEEINGEEKTEMQELLETVIDELESDRVLDANNEVIKTLRSDFPDQFDELQITCQTVPFENVFNLLVAKSTKMRPQPFVPFLDVEKTKKANKYVWNERGEKLIVRLSEFYTFVQTAE